MLKIQSVKNLIVWLNNLMVDIFYVAECKKKEKRAMTLEAVENAIARLIVSRRENADDEQEQAKINAKLTKLYDIRNLLKYGKI